MSTLRSEAGWYEFHVQGRLDPRWETWFDGMTLTTSADDTSVIRGRVADQAALHGLLARLRDLGLPLLSVVKVDPERRDDDPAASEPAG